MARVDASLIARPYKQAGRQRSMPSSSSRMRKVMSKVSIIPFLYRENIKTDVAKGCFWPVAVVGGCRPEADGGSQASIEIVAIEFHLNIPSQIGIIAVSCSVSPLTPSTRYKFGQLESKYSSMSSKIM